MRSLFGLAKGLRARRGVRQLVKFCLVGGFNTALDFGIYFGLTRTWPFFAHHYLMAATASFSVAVVSSFLLNTFWTFRAAEGAWQRRAPRFFAVALVGVSLNAGIIFLLVEGGLHDMLAKIAATGIVLMWNFTAQKFWTFKAAP